MQTEAFQGCQAHNSFVCYAIETSCSLLSQYLLPNGMCALLLPLLNNTRLEEGLITSRLSPLVILCPSSSFPPSSLSHPPYRLIPSFLYSPLALSEFCHSLSPPSSLPPLFCRSHIISLASAPPFVWQKKQEEWKLHIRLGTERIQTSALQNKTAK